MKESEREKYWTSLIVTHNYSARENERNLADKAIMEYFPERIDLRIIIQCQKSDDEEVRKSYAKFGMEEIHKNTVHYNLDFLNECRGPSAHPRVRDFCTDLIMKYFPHSLSS